MKIRLNYVSNSSSSSFVCQVCGREESGFDLGLEEAEMLYCEKGHLFCEHEMNKDICAKNLLDVLYFEEDKKDNYFAEELEKLGTEKVPLKLLEEIISEYFYENDRDDVASIFCPICTLKHILPYDLIKYLESKYNFKQEEVEDEIRKKFKCLQELKEDIKNT